MAGKIKIFKRVSTVLFAWGANTYRQQGRGDDGTSYSSPVQVGSFQDWSYVDSCQNTFAIRRGKLYAAGRNGVSGVLGFGTRTQVDTLTQLGSAEDWTQAKIGNSDIYNEAAAAAFIRGGRLFTCGYNTYGTLGVGDRFSRSSPVQVGSETDWDDCFASLLVTGGFRGGRLFVSGFNDDGRLGVGDRTRRSSPIQVGSETDWTTVYFSNYGTLGIRSGKLFGWGGNVQYCLGLGDLNARSSPVQVGSEEDWTYVISMGASTAGIRAGKLFTWGLNDNGVLGLGDTDTRSSPVQVGSDSDWAMVHVGNNYHALGLKTDGRLFAWGLNTSGQLGDGTIVSKSSPVQVGSDTDWRVISAGENCSFGIRGL